MKSRQHGAWRSENPDRNIFCGECGKPLQDSAVHELVHCAPRETTRAWRTSSSTGRVSTSPSCCPRSELWRPGRVRTVPDAGSVAYTCILELFQSQNLQNMDSSLRPSLRGRLPRTGPSRQRAGQVCEEANSTGVNYQCAAHQWQYVAVREWRLAQPATHNHIQKHT